MSILAAALSKIERYDRNAERECLIGPLSNLIIKILDILKQNNYIKDYEIITKERGGAAKVLLLGKINSCGTTPRFSLSLKDFEKYEKRFLPAFNVGILIISTSQGLFSHREAKEKHLGGRIIAYCY